MRPERLIKSLKRLGFILHLQCQHIVEHMRMRTDRPLAENDQAAGDNIRALDRDANWYRAVEWQQVVERPVDHSFARMHIHRVIQRLAHFKGRVGFHNGRNDGKRTAFIQASAG